MKARMKKRVREITKRNRGRELKAIIKELTQYLRGWQHYLKLASKPSVMGTLDSWIRRRLRSFRLKQKSENTA